jgi:hypothetical protein
MGPICATLLADLFIYVFEAEFKQKLIKDRKIKKLMP